MASPTLEVAPMLASSIRVLRHITTAEALLAAWPTLKQKGLLPPPTWTDSERRIFLDLPDADTERANIGAATTLSRDQLIAKAVSKPGSLTQAEVELLKNRFWTPGGENAAFSRSICQATEEGLKEFFEARELDDVPDEQRAFGAGEQESRRREQAVEHGKLRAVAALALPFAKEWIQELYRRDTMKWGFVCLYDAAAQQIDPVRMEHFNARLGGFFRHALLYNGSKDIIDRKWSLLPFNAPSGGYAPSENNDAPSNDGALLRTAFRDILRDAQGYQNRADVTSPNTVTQHLKNDIAAAGYLANTFLVIDPVCVDSVLLNDGKWFDDMRVLAFEADFPVQGREYEEGYRGFAWVRLDQLVYNFYELRLLGADDVGMDRIWKAAQPSKDKAFVSMDPDEALSWTTTCSLTGWTRDSVLGKRWYEMRERILGAGSVG